MWFPLKGLPSLLPKICMCACARHPAVWCTASAVEGQSVVCCLQMCRWSWQLQTWQFGSLHDGARMFQDFIAVSQVCLGSAESVCLSLKGAEGLSELLSWHAALHAVVSQSTWQIFWDSLLAACSQCRLTVALQYCNTLVCGAVSCIRNAYRWLCADLSAEMHSKCTAKGRNMQQSVEVFWYPLA